jgi:thiol reductant ABC exporter CydD subunit
LVRFGRTTRLFVVLSVVAGTARAVLLVAQAWLLATVVAGAFVDGRDLAQLRRPMALLLVLVALRALLAWSSDVAADRCAARVKSMLRAALVERVAALGRDGKPVTRSGEVVTLAVEGIDALDAYFGRYLPQLVLAVTVPVTILVAVLKVDWVSAAILAVTLPVIPVFMALIGMATRAHTDRQLRTLQVLSGRFLEVVRGLTTLKVFGRSRAQAEVIAEVTHRYRQRLMATLRITFLSSLALELLASVSVAIVAVAVGLRLLAGHLDLKPALFVLVLAPEAYLPLRQLGADYHASAEGVSAAEQIFEVLDQPIPVRGARRTVPDPAATGLAVDSLCFTYPGRDHPAIEGLSLHVDPGEVVAVTGPSGCGKSTLLAVLLGLVQPDAGTVCIGDVELAGLDPDAWRKQIAWVPQRPHLFATTIADNIRLAKRDATESELRCAVRDAGLEELVVRLPDGLETRLGDGGAGLSAGERQRVALARAFVRAAPLVLLDEPTANLDGRTELAVVDAVRRLTGGRTAVIVAHRPALVALADRVVDLAPAEVLA